jgi:hypothetical protein
MGPTALHPLWRMSCCGFYRGKNPSPSAGVEIANRGYSGKYVTIRPPGRLVWTLLFSLFVEPVLCVSLWDKTRHCDSNGFQSVLIGINPETLTTFILVRSLNILVHDICMWRICLKMSTLVFWVLTSCAHVCKVKTQLPWRWWRCVSPKRWYLPTSAHGVTAQTIIFFTVVRTRNFNRHDGFWSDKTWQETSY